MTYEFSVVLAIISDTRGERGWIWDLGGSRAFFLCVVFGVWRVCGVWCAFVCALDLGHWILDLRPSRKVRDGSLWSF